MYLQVEQLYILCTFHEYDRSSSTQRRCTVLKNSTATRLTSLYLDSTLTLIQNTTEESYFELKSNLKLKKLKIHHLSSGRHITIENGLPTGHVERTTAKFNSIVQLAAAHTLCLTTVIVPATQRTYTLLKAAPQLRRFNFEKFVGSSSVKTSEFYHVKTSVQPTAISQTRPSLNDSN
ncbi:hypothetical protein WN51_13385 [Melipona quadrifasciata]|uniref:Uncharacterized protein n=1 Tax=Melipona quadrifasciata TaxID=166423 RepID=A0A0N0U5F8_9HYME|nr:hypothetical protein WN51_13385 [Melipona quadrifasciata]